MLNPVPNRNSVLAWLADRPEDNHARQLALFVYETLVCHEAVLFQQVKILSKQFAVHLEEFQTDKPVRVTLKLCKLK